MVRVHSGPWQGEPAADGNCVVARRRGKEAGGQPATRGTRTGLGQRAWASPPDRAKPHSCPEGARVNAAGVRGSSRLLPGEVWRRDHRIPLHVSGARRGSTPGGNVGWRRRQKSAEAVVAAVGSRRRRAERIAESSARCGSVIGRHPKRSLVSPVGSGGWPRASWGRAGSPPFARVGVVRTQRRHGRRVKEAG